VREVERLGDEFEAPFLAEVKLAGEAHIHGSEIVPDEGVAGLDAHAIVVSEDVAVGVESSELREAHRRLNGGNQADQEVPREGIPGLWRGCGRIEHQAVADIVRRKSALRTEVLAVLWNQDKAGIRPIVDGFGPGVA